MSEQIIHNWDTYAEEANVPDFVLRVGENEEIRFTNPTGVSVMRISEGVRKGDLKLVLMGLAGENYERMERLIAGAGHAALPKLIEDLMDHFNMYDEYEMVAPSGRVYTKKRPTEIKRLLQEGWTFKGESPASLG